MAKGIFYTVFVLPASLSVVLASAVMVAALQDPNLHGAGEASDSITIVGLQDNYTSSEPIAITVTVDDPDYDCGDLYITISEYQTGAVIRQNGYFEQCYVQDDLELPSDDIFSETVGLPGEYRIRAEINDVEQEKSIFTTAKFEVR